MRFLYSTQGSDKICQDLQRSAKICQEQTRSTKRSASTNLQAPLAETNHETPSSKNKGAAVSRRMASSIRSGPVGARGVFNSKLAFPIFYISFKLVFFLGYILSGRFFDVKLGGCGVTPPTAQTLFFASIFSITVVPFTHVIPTSATPDDSPQCSHFGFLFDHTCTFYLRNTYKCAMTVFLQFKKKKLNEKKKTSNAPRHDF
jgi:hypothetical protein